MSTKNRNTDKIKHKEKQPQRAGVNTKGILSFVGKTAMIAAGVVLGGPVGLALAIIGALWLIFQLFKGTGLFNESFAGGKNQAMQGNAAINNKDVEMTDLESSAVPTAPPSNRSPELGLSNGAPELKADRRAAVEEKSFNGFSSYEKIAALTSGQSFGLLAQPQGISAYSVPSPTPPLGPGANSFSSTAGLEPV